MQGDSGGPLNCLVDNVQRVAGIASFVIVGCNVQRPAGYTRVSTYVPWINRNIE